MSSGMVGEALRARFDAVRRSELDRLSRKLSGLSDTDRESVEAIVAHVVDALVRVPSQGLADAPPPEALRAIVHLFDLQPSL
jgi:glutamyl-tRNA reductase